MLSTLSFCLVSLLKFPKFKVKTIPAPDFQDFGMKSSRPPPLYTQNHLAQQIQARGI